MISAGIWAFHFGYDNTGWPSMERAATLLENSGRVEELYSGWRGLGLVAGEG